MHYNDNGTNFDLVFISAICHMLSPKGNQNMLQRAKKQAMAEGYRFYHYQGNKVTRLDRFDHGQKKVAQ